MIQLCRDVERHQKIDTRRPNEPLPLQSTHPVSLFQRKPRMPSFPAEIYIPTPCKPIENSAVALVLANFNVSASESARRRRPSCIGVQRTCGGGKEENLMLDGISSARLPKLLSAADSRVYWL